MIRQSFIFLDGINEKTEKHLWSLGLKEWDDFTKSQKVHGISDTRKQHYDRKLSEAKHNLYSFKSSYFKGLLPTTETWRLYDFFKEDTCFLDIETTGMSRDSLITTVGIFDGIETKNFVHGINLNSSALKDELSKYKIIVTFNGASFDLPCIEKKYPGVLPSIPHIDLRYACAKIGLRGGLKMIEKELGIKRSNPIIERMYGGDAVTMWRMYKGSGDPYYLKLLIEYNEEDCINMKSIANKVYSQLCAKTLSEKSQSF